MEKACHVISYDNEVLPKKLLKGILGYFKDCTCGPTPPATAKYVFYGLVPEVTAGDLHELAVNARASGGLGKEGIGICKLNLPSKPVARPAKKADKRKMMPVAVAVTCHVAYIPILGNCLNAIDAQTARPAEKFLCLDSCDVSADFAAAYPDWKILKGDWHSPNPGRNAALFETKSDWIWFVDADDTPDPKYLAGAATHMGNARVGIIHADLVHTGVGQKRKSRMPQVLEYWQLRLRNYVSTESVWRVCALREAGGWRNTQRFDDWTCALNVTRLGWQTSKNPVSILYAAHPRTVVHRNVTGQLMGHKLERSYAVVMLLAGRRDCWKDWAHMVLNMEYPPKTHFYFLDNSSDQKFAEDFVGVLAARLRMRGFGTTIETDNTKFDTVDRYSRHRHVAHLYNHICPKIGDDVTVFWEDDNIPYTTTALMDLIAHWEFRGTGGITAMYETRNKPGLVCGSPDKEYWATMLPIAECRGKLHTDWGFVPGGFTLYNTAFVKNALPFHVDLHNGKPDGWDGKMSRAVRKKKGWRLDLDGTVEVEHRFKGATVKKERVAV